MYHGEVKIFHEHLNRFLDIAQKFKLEGLLLPQQEYENNMKTSSTCKGSSEEKEFKRESVENILIDNNVAQDRSLKVLNESIEANNSEVESKFLELVCLKDKIYTCTICEKTMNHKGSMRRHLETHLTGLSYECSWCAQVFNTRMQLANHKRIHNKYTRYAYLCTKVVLPEPAMPSTMTQQGCWSLEPAPAPATPGTLSAAASVTCGSCSVTASGSCTFSAILQH